MRDEFVKILMEKAELDQDLMLLTGDLGFGVLTEFSKRFPKQFLNVGVAEQNMAGVATGLALEGKIVFTYSIANFNTLRSLEQIRNDICYHNANVKVVSIGGGFSYGQLGISHHATEDLAIMSSIPNLHILAPGDKVETRLATIAAYETSGPFYIRLGRGGEPELYRDQPFFKIGKAIPFTLNEDSDIALLSTGGILENVVKAGKVLMNQGINNSIFSVHTLRPFDVNMVYELANKVKYIFTVEEHIKNGGLGSRVAEILSEMYIKKALLIRIGLGERFNCEVGDQSYLREINGLSPGGIAEKVLNTITKYESWRNSELNLGS
jgi:transketolase